MDPTADRFTIPPRTEAVGRARHHIRRLLELAKASPQLVDQAELVVAEMLTNAVQHAEPPIELELNLAADGLTIRVTDHSPAALPRQLPPMADRIGGWGMLILDSLADDWGVARFEHHKVVWVRLPLRSRLPPAVSSRPL